mmetsp:Transcript_35750/g.57475  ORF Transcript_35750/g.57475 Transcript_35750/m.57475 type:complete len:527 (-) Transcript_35750:423-2003(-)
MRRKRRRSLDRDADGDSSPRCKCVHWDKRVNKWRARGTVQGKHVHIGCYDIEEDAAHAYQDYVEHGTLPARKVPTPAFTGVSWHETRKGWRAQISKNGKKTNLGVFDTQQDAALVYNAAVTRLGCPASWLYDVAHAGCAGNDELHNSEGVPAGKKSVVAVRAKPPHRRPPTGTHAVGTSKTPPPAAVGGPAAQHLTPFVVQHEADTMHSKARMVTPGVAGLAPKAGVPSWTPCSPRRWPDTFKTVRACRIASCTGICDKAYTARSRVCLKHMQALSTSIDGESRRFCQKCTRFHTLDLFEGTHRSCTAQRLKQLQKAKRPRTLQEGGQRGMGVLKGVGLTQLDTEQQDPSTKVYKRHRASKAPGAPAAAAVTTNIPAHLGSTSQHPVTTLLSWMADDVFEDASADQRQEQLGHALGTAGPGAKAEVKNEFPSPPSLSVNDISPAMRGLMGSVEHYHHRQQQQEYLHHLHQQQQQQLIRCQKYEEQLLHHQQRHRLDMGFSGGGDGVGGSDGVGFDAAGSAHYEQFL